MQLNPVGEFVFLNLPMYFSFHNPSISLLALVHDLLLSVFIFYVPLLCFLPSDSFIQFFSSFCFSSPHSPEFLNFCVRKWINHAEVFSLSLSLYLSLFHSLSVSFHLSFFCFLLSSLPERKERHRVIGFPLIARVMLTVHKSCH